MRDLISDWMGKAVTVTLQSGGLATAVRVDGTLLRVSDAGVLLQLPKGQTFVPVASILHVSLLDAH
jgi:hypothetical protein